METALEVDVSEAARLLQQPGTILLDVREPHEWEICLVPGSRTIPMGQIPARLEELPRDQPILVLCHHGSRSRRFTLFLRANNYPLATNVAGGIDAWAEILAPDLPRY